MTANATVRPPTIADVVTAAGRLAGVAHRTPVVTSRTLDEQVGAQVFLKVETLQRVGAFKFRGAYNAIAALADDTRRRGVVAWSSGNHAQAVALAAQLLGTTATIVMPSDAPPAKLAATRGYGAEVVTYDRYRDDREAIGAKLAADRGATIIPPFDHPDVIAGQATAALELVEEVGRLDLIVVPIGGGGLAAGCALVAAAQDPPGRVVAAEPEVRHAARDALVAGHPVTVAVPTTIMDGQQTTCIGALATQVLAATGGSAVGVTEEQVIDAMRFLAQRCKLVVEPSGAAGLAALRAAVGALGDLTPDLRIGVILSGGNVDLSRYAALLA